ncbi:MAG: hypothetical protein U1E69_15240 [Tabrizicola sp.]|uniref:hypothetical protein n=1 Tax=Tabrizicola sp. TaxID=2005166 RepID=UPI002ABA73CD|nr:hypothetical protein [Tabrizicola sp.]MDZ4088142.1 hypothetical protein [Tabrizicola sp.]
MRPAALVFLTTLPLQAQTADPLPNFPLDSAITCLAYTVSAIEADPKGDIAAARADWLVFFSGLVAAKSTPADTKVLGDRFAKELLFYRAPSFEEGTTASPAEVDEILTGTARMCWFDALAADGGPYADQ